MLGKIGMGELLVILVIVLLIFGPSKLPSLAKSMGQAISEFKKGTKELTKDIDKCEDDSAKEKKESKEDKEDKESK